MAIDEEITLRKLEVFLAFMKHGSMSAVADSMGLSTVSVHRALHSLQAGLRCPLFKRDGKSLIPLAHAHTFAEFASRSVKECEEGIRRTRLAAGFEATRIKIGSGYSLTVRTIPQLVYGLQSRRPNLGVDLTLGSTRGLLDQLRNDTLDAALVVMTEEEPDDEFVALTLFHDPVHFAAALGSKFSGRASIDLRELKNEKFVALNADFLTFQAMQPLFEAAGFSPDIVMRAGNLFSLANLVGDGIGYGLLPARVGLFTTKVELIPLAAPFTHRQTIRLLLQRPREREPNLLALTAECRMLPEVLQAQRAPLGR